jgi:protease PrsW
MGSWWPIFRSALALYAGGVLLLLATENASLFPTVVILGNFLVPATYVAYFYEHRHLTALSVATTALSFIYGGALGVFAAAVLEPLFIDQLGFRTAFVVGLIEEFGKVLGVWVIARRRRHDSEIEGLLLGFAAGTGFAAFESTSYAFAAFVRSGGTLSVRVLRILLRGLIAPLGHATWTGLLAGAWFRESRAGRFRLTGPVLGAYVTVVILHGLWDGLLHLRLSGLVLSFGFVVLAALSVGGFWWRWQTARHLARPEPLPPA